MCKHVLNAQVSIRFPCCMRFYDCVDCHEEGKEGGKLGHAVKLTEEMVFMCKGCGHCFRKNMMFFEEADEYCPHCGNHFVITAQTPATEKAEKEAAAAMAAKKQSTARRSSAGAGAGAGASARSSKPPRTPLR